jgi:hypothetical protein
MHATHQYQNNYTQLAPIYRYMLPVSTSKRQNETENTAHSYEPRFNQLAAHSCVTSTVATRSATVKK